MGLPEKGERICSPLQINGNMNYDPDKHKRKSLRLKEYDYSQPGAYFITICTHNRICLFGEVNNGKVVLNEHGNMAQKCLLAIPDHYPHANLDHFIVMPNHIHLIIEIIAKANVGANNYSPLPHGTSKTIGSIVRGCKIGITKHVRKNMDIYHIWQRNYYEHIIRDEVELNDIRQYIINNPTHWTTDENNPEILQR